MTKSQAIEALMREYHGVVTLQIIYNEIEKFYPDAKRSTEWQAGLRGVLYRDIGKKFKKLDDATYAIIDYDLTNLVPLSERIGVTEKEVLAKIRTLQYKFRDRLLNDLKHCQFTRFGKSYISGIAD